MLFDTEHFQIQVPIFCEGFFAVWRSMLNYPSMLLPSLCIIQPESGATVSPGSPYTLITLGMTQIPARQAASHLTADLSVILS